MMEISRKLNKNGQDPLCSALTDVDYQVYNITELANDLLKLDTKSLTRALWIKFTKNYVKQCNYNDRRGMKHLSFAFTNFVNFQNQRTFRKWKLHFQWRKISQKLLSTNRIKDCIIRIKSASFSHVDI